MKPNPSILHLWLYRKIRKKANGRIYLPYATILEIMKRTLHQFPKTLHYPILKEMEKYKLLKKIDRKMFEITGGNADLVLNQYNCPI